MSAGGVVLPALATRLQLGYVMTSQNLRVDQLREIHRCCSAFEASWATAQRSRIEDVLEPYKDAELQDELLLALLRSEFELRRDRGETPKPEEYTRRFPDSQSVVERAFDEPAMSSTSTSDGYELAATNGDRASPGRHCVAHYVIEREIDRGGMGVVYRAFDRKLERVVALKVILAGHHASPADVQRFRIEARAVARLDHPGIVPVYEIGEWAGHCYLAMSLVQGASLAELLAQRRLPARRAAEILQQIADAVQYAHEAGVIHRDLKPRNILIDDAGRARVTDFGLAKIVRNPKDDDGAHAKLSVQDGVTASGQVLGTPHYMSPEQAAGRHDDIAATTDIFSLGAILYEMLSGRPPFQAPTLLETLQKIHHATPAPLDRENRETPRDLATICAKCLEKDPRRRYERAADLSEDLARFLSGRAVLARPVSSIEHSVRWCRRNPAFAVLLAAVAFLLLAIVLGSFIAAVSLQREARRAQHAEREAVQAEQARRRELFRVYLAEARSVTTANPPASQHVAKRAIRSALAAVNWQQLSDQWQHELLDVAVPCLTLMEVQECSRDTILPRMHVDNRLPEADVDDRLNTIIVPRDEGHVTVVKQRGSPQSGHEYGVEGPTERTPSVRMISSNGRWIVETQYFYKQDKRQLLVWDHTTHQLVLQTTQGTRGVVISPNSDRLIVPDGEQLKLYQLEGGALVSESPARFRDAIPALPLQGDLLAVASYNMPAEIIDLATWETLATFPSLGHTSSLVWHPDGQRVYFATVDGQLYVCSRHDQSWTARLIAQESTAEIDRLITSPDGQWIASSDQLGITRLRQVEDERAVIQISGCAVRFSADSRELATLDGHDLVILGLNDSPLVREIPTQVASADFSPDGRWLGLAGMRGVHLYDASRLTLTADLGLDEAGPVAFHPDGTRLATFGKYSQPLVWPITSGSVVQLGPPKPVMSAAQESFWILRPHHDGRSLAWSERGDFLAVGHWRDDRVMIVGDRHERDQTLQTNVAPSRVVAAPDGSWVATLDRAQPKVVVSGVSSESEILRLPHVDMAMSADGSYFATRGASNVSIFQTSSWKSVATLDISLYPGPLGCSMAFQPSGWLLAVVDHENAIRLYDRRSQNMILRLRQPSARAAHWLSFSPDGTRLAVTHRDSVVVWDLVNLRRELAALGLPAKSLPTHKNRHPRDNRPDAESSTDERQGAGRQVLSVHVDRGSLPDASRWYDLDRRMARYEAAVRRDLPDAIEAMNRALRMLPHDSDRERAELLIERGRYLLANRNAGAASDDWLRALDLHPNQPDAMRQLAWLYTLGPLSVRDAQRAEPFAAWLSAQPDHSSSGYLLLAINRVSQGVATDQDRKRLQDSPQADSALRIIGAFWLALDQETRGLRAEARTSFTRAKEMYENLAADLPTEGRAYVQRVQDEVTRQMSP